MKSPRLIAHKALDKMVNYETGGWRFYKGVDYRNVRDVVTSLEASGTEFKHYFVTTAVKGLYNDVVLVRR